MKLSELIEQAKTYLDETDGDPEIVVNMGGGNYHAASKIVPVPGKEGVVELLARYE